MANRVVKNFSQFAVGLWRCWSIFCLDFDYLLSELVVLSLLWWLLLHCSLLLLACLFCSRITTKNEQKRYQIYPVNLFAVWLVFCVMLGRTCVKGGWLLCYERWFGVLF